MLHELSHIIHGPHDAKFHALWNQLRDEHEALALKGYSGEGFLSDGHRLGGRQIPMSEARRLARVQAEKRRAMGKGSGQKLGGTAAQPWKDMRSVIADASERRLRALQGCGNTNHNDSEIQEISDAATRNGFKTQAEEDAANDAAIAQALWELVQEDEKAKYGENYIPPTAENPAGNGGGVFSSADRDSVPGPSRSELPSSKAAEPSSSSLPQPKPTPPPAAGIAVEVSTSSSSSALPDTWACGVCTLVNPDHYLCCDACGTEKPSKTGKRSRVDVDLTTSPTKPSSKKPVKSINTTKFQTPPVPAGLETWQCSFCGQHMERQWWTCSTCGNMKNSSR